MMIKKNIFLLGLLFSICLNSLAQKAAYLILDTHTFSIDNLLMKDSLAAGKIDYTASFTLAASNDPSLQILLKSLQKGNLNLYIYYTTTGGSFTEKQYKNAAILEWQFQKLDAASRIASKIEIKIRSSQVTETENLNLAFKTNFSYAILSSNFLVSINNLPSSRISSVSEIEIKNNTLISFEIQLSDMGLWKKWFSDSGKKLNGSIFLLSPNMKDKLLQINLSNIELVSISQNITVSDRSVNRFTAVVRVGTVSLADAK